MAKIAKQVKQRGATVQMWKVFLAASFHVVCGEFDEQRCSSLCCNDSVVRDFYGTVTRTGEQK